MSDEDNQKKEPQLEPVVVKETHAFGKQDNASKPVLIADGMGVIYQEPDVVNRLLVPFVKANGGAINEKVVEQLHIGASLGKVDADEFWDLVGLKKEYEPHYLARIELMPGIRAFLTEARNHFQGVICMSNDVSRWSKKLRQSFNLDKLVDRWVISGDVGQRKPEGHIINTVIQVAGVPRDQLIVVDANRDALNMAARMGLRTVLYLPGDGVHVEGGKDNDSFRKADEAMFRHTIARNFEELLMLQKRGAILPAAENSAPVTTQ